MQPSINKYRLIINKRNLDIKSEEIVLYRDTLPKIYTIVGLLNDDLKNKIFKQASILKNKFPNQFYYPKDRYHFTIIGNFVIKKSEEKLLISILSKIIKKYKLFGKVIGCGISATTVSAMVYFNVRQIKGLRTELRHEIKKHFDVKIDSFPSIFDNVAWVNFIRYKEKPKPGFFEIINSLKNKRLGSLKNFRIAFCITKSKSFDQSKTKILKTFKI